MARQDNTGTRTPEKKNKPRQDKKRQGHKKERQNKIGTWTKQAKT